MLNAKQKAFAEYYVISKNATDAAKKAGYSSKTAYAIGAENLKKVEISDYIKERTLKAQNERIATATEVLEYLSETMRNTEETRRERTKAAELLGKRYGLFTEQQEQAQDKINLQINLMRTDENNDK